MIHGIYIIYALIFLLVPLFGIQALIVKTSGMKYSEFISNARKELLKF
ncbi:hypothetical protein [Methanosphaera sp.]